MKLWSTAGDVQLLSPTKNVVDKTRKEVLSVNRPRITGDRY